LRYVYSVAIIVDVVNTGRISGTIGFIHNTRIMK
jgi:hypothetical protein